MTISCWKWLKTAIDGGKTCCRLLLSRRMMMMNFKVKTSRSDRPHDLSWRSTLITLLHIALRRISFEKCYSLNYNSTNPADLGIRRGRYKQRGRRAEGMFEVNLACIDLLYTATHIERSLKFFSDMHIRQKFQ